MVYNERGRTGRINFVYKMHNLKRSILFKSVVLIDITSKMLLFFFCTLLVIFIKNLRNSHFSIDTLPFKNKTMPSSSISPGLLLLAKLVSKVHVPLSPF